MASTLKQPVGFDYAAFIDESRRFVERAASFDEKTLAGSEHFRWWKLAVDDIVLKIGG